MEELAWGVMTGSVGGVLSAVIVLVIARYWTNVLEPWFENLVSKGVAISGVWKTEMEIAGNKKGEIALLEQRGHRVWGTVTYPEDTLGNSHTYKLHGVFFDNVFTALMEEIGQGRLDRGAVVMTIKPGTSLPIMEGLGVWFDGSTPVAIRYTWRRERN